MLSKKLKKPLIHTVIYSVSYITNSNSAKKLQKHLILGVQFFQLKRGQHLFQLKLVNRLVQLEHFCLEPLNSGRILVVAYSSVISIISNGADFLIFSDLYAAEENKVLYEM